MAYYPEPVARLIDALQRLPGIGPKTAQRLTFFLLKRPADEVRELAESLLAVKERIVSCSACFPCSAPGCWKKSPIAAGTACASSTTRSSR